MDATTRPSPEVLAANEILLDLRAQHRAARPSPERDKQPASCKPQPAAVSDFAAIIAKLPAHLGWESASATVAVRHTTANRESPILSHETVSPPNSDSSPDTRAKAQSTDAVEAQGKTPDGIKNYSLLGVAALKRNQARVYRVYLGMQYLDENGRGWLSIAQLKKQFCNTKSSLYLFGWRRMRQILHEGEGRFWNWNKEKESVWLRGTDRVAAELGVGKCRKHPVLLPVSALKNIGTFKAHLFAAWFSGRKTKNPISRSQLEELTGVPQRTQREYCEKAGIERQYNIAIGLARSDEESVTWEERIEEEAWKRGMGFFVFHDVLGYQEGKPKTDYLARQLPCSHKGPHPQLPKGRVKKINRKLKVLVNKVTRGNSSIEIDRIYYANDKQIEVAAKNIRVDEVYRSGIERQETRFWLSVPVR